MALVEGGDHGHQFCPSARAGQDMRRADQRAGAYSILTGVAANQSMATGQLVTIESPSAGHRAARLSAMPSPQGPFCFHEKALLARDGCRAIICGRS